MADLIVGSKLPSENKYGQNGYTGASSDTPGQKTSTGVLPQVTVPTDKWQTRDVGTSKVANGYGMKKV
jgi:hypothetical protein